MTAETIKRARTLLDMAQTNYAYTLMIHQYLFGPLTEGKGAPSSSSSSSSSPAAPDPLTLPLFDQINHYQTQTDMILSRNDSLLGVIAEKLSMKEIMTVKSNAARSTQKQAPSQAPSTPPISSFSSSSLPTIDIGKEMDDLVGSMNRVGQPTTAADRSDR